MRSFCRPLLLVLPLCMGWAGCTSRTTPLPPPEISSISAPSDDGLVTVKGFALEGASIGAVNDRTLLGVITISGDETCRSVCEFTAVLAADSGDSVRVWQFFETESAQQVPVPKR